MKSYKNTLLIAAAISTILVLGNNETNAAGVDLKIVTANTPFKISNFNGSPADCQVTNGSLGRLSQYGTIACSNIDLSSLGEFTVTADDGVGESCQIMASSQDGLYPGDNCNVRLTTAMSNGTWVVNLPTISSSAKRK